MTIDQHQEHGVARPAVPTMTAVVQDEYGEADVLRVERIARPEPGPTEVLVRVRAAGVDRGVWHLMTGLPYPVRLAGYGVRAPKQRVRGAELAGTVEAVGSEVTRFRVGDEVFGAGDGSFAECTCAAEGALEHRPAALGAEQAAALVVSGCTALRAVRDQGRLRPGQSVLVIGASGGVGSYAVQIAVALGARVTGVASAGKVDLVRSLGAAHVVDYTSESIVAAGRRYDLVIDCGGSRPLRELRRVLTPTGTLVIVGGETGGRWLGGSDRQLRAMALSPFVSQRLVTLIATPSAEDLAVLARMAEEGTIRPAVERSFPLHEAAQAVRHVSEGRARGKVVVSVRP